ncbi:MAG TPA: hypothetical protein VMB47_00190 [Candidatus Aquilonibacter sp.]|nr:hypothetical protein [Candidatus Aquilonibacter sp.]
MAVKAKHRKILFTPVAWVIVNMMNLNLFLGDTTNAASSMGAK